MMREALQDPNGTITMTTIDQVEAAEREAARAQDAYRKAGSDPGYLLFNAAYRASAQARRLRKEFEQKRGERG
jgi:hypothetical protein